MTGRCKNKVKKTHENIEIKKFKFKFDHLNKYKNEKYLSLKENVIFLATHDSPIIRDERLLITFVKKKKKKKKKVCGYHT